MTHPMVTTDALPMRPGRTPRLWQLRALNAARLFLAKHKAVIISAATGTGKGDLIAGLAVLAARKGGRVLVLAERDNLVNEIPDRIRQIPGAPRCGVVKASRNEWLNPIVSASVQSVSRRLDAAKRYAPTLVLTDECHHSLADSYVSTYAALTNSYRHIGFSATPFRTGPDGTTLGLGKVFEAIAFEYPIQAAIEAGDLVPIRAYQVDSKVSLDTVRVGKDGDYDEDDLARVVDCDSRNDLVVDEYEKLLQGQPAGVFCVNIAHADHMAERFRARGYDARSVSGQTKDRHRILRDFKEGRFPVICSCDLIREGWDAPNVVGILKARPTKSLLVFMQMLGRGTRTSPETGKTECIFVDFVDNGCTFDLEAIANLSADEAAAQAAPLQIGDNVERRHYLEWGVGVVLDLRDMGEVQEFLVGWPPSDDRPTGTKTWHPRVELRRPRVTVETEEAATLQPKVIQAHRYEIQLFGRLEKGETPVGWYEYDGALVAGGTLGEPLRRFEQGRWRAHSTELRLYLEGRPTGWEVWSIVRTPRDVDGDVVYDEKVTRERSDLFDRGTAVLWAQEHLRALGVRVVDHKAAWRGEGITEAQRKALRSWGIRRDLDNMSRGEASVLMDAVIARRKVQAKSPRRKK